ncbi:hypothetical protein [Myceligenerans pegani]|uniref:Uncharacterized protein n=1 Tax=Myceligenerans pegani TaxID=2776917 RepID=A0ABR9MXK8_9MICO|nr:hypothetical protein [Myceligenerans sp. TRM 65318]MBE1876108.1 hypothetical protein [Myceligenerans sp. TRM 65318]MBE3018379.1 hypothetical protein [Myceligenerans sp. TRM 65318]
MVLPVAAFLAIKTTLAADGAKRRDLVEALESHKIGISILADRYPRDASIREVFEQVAALPEVLRPWGVRWIATRAPRGDLARVIYEALVLDGPAATGRVRVEASLALIRPIASVLPEAQAVRLIRPLWTLASAPSDPYSPSGHRSAASTALVGLLGVRRDIRPAIIDLVKSRPPRERPLILDLIARSVRTAGSEGSEAFREFVPLLGMTISETERFARIADLRERTKAEPRTNAQAHRFAPHRLRAIYRVLLIFHPVALLALAFHYPNLNSRLESLENFAGIPLEVGIALIAVMATIHVFTVQFATSRLPAAVARVTGEPWQLWGGYVSGAALVVATVVSQGVDGDRLWVAVEMLLLLDTLIWLGSALSRTFHRTGTAEACRVYMRRHMHNWRRAGRRLGVIQVRAAELKRAIDPLPFAGSGSAREIVGRDLIRIDASRRGIFLPVPRKISRILVNPIFAGPVYLQFSCGFGLIAAEAERLATVRIANGRLPARLEKRLAKVLRPTNASKIENVSSDAISLSALALRIADSGDLRLAEEVAENAAQVVVAHLGEAQQARARNSVGVRRNIDSEDSTETVYPVTPALRDVLDFLVQRVAEREGVWKTADVVVRRCLSSSTRDDRAAMILVSLIGDSRHDFPASPASEWLRHAGLNALQHDDDFAFQAAVRALRQRAQLFTGESSASRALVSLCAASLRLGPDRFDTAWTEAMQWLRASSSEVATRISLQVGASALDCGGFRAVVICAMQVVSDERFEILNNQTSYDRVFGEAALAELSAVDVGDTPTDRLEHFRDLVSAIRESSAIP